MAEKTETPKVPQHLLSDNESRKWKVVDIAVVSPTSVTALLQNNQEWCIDTFDYDENEYQRSKRICLQTNLKEPPLLLSYVHVENKLKHFVCTKTKLHLIDDESESIEKSVSLSAEPSALCVEDNKVYISTNETKTLMFFKLELPTDTSKIYLKDISEHDSIAEFVVHSKNIYVCTKGGKVSSHKETGEKQHDYRNRKSMNSKARGLAVFTPQGKECNLLLVTWSDNTLYIYSTKSHHDLLDIDLNVPGKIRVTTSCFLMSSEVNDVAVYNMKTVADRGAFKMITVSGSREEDLSYLINYVLHDATAPFSRNFFIKRKILATLIEMYDYSCITNDNLNAENKKLKDEIDRSKKEKDDLTEELKNTRSNLSRKEADLSDVKAKLDDARTESDELRRINEEKEEKCDCLTKQLESEKKTTEELKNEIDRSKKEKDDLTEELENTRSKLSTKEADLSDVRATLDEARTESDELRIMKEGKEEKCCSLTKQLEEERKTTEELKQEIDSCKKEKDDLTEELENTRSKLSTKEAELSDVKATLDDAKTESDELRIMNKEKEEKCCSLTKQLEAERKATEEARTDNDDLRRMNEEKEKICDSLKQRLETAKKTTEEGDTTKDIHADSTENMKTCLKDLINGINKDTVALTKQKDDVTRELESTKSALKKKEVDRSQIQDELDAAISKKKELEETAMETDKLKQTIEAKEKEIQWLQKRLKIVQTDVENAKTQVTILQGRKQELQKSLSREQDKSEKLERLLSNAYSCSFEYNKNIAQLEDAYNRLKIEYDKSEKTQALFSDILENLGRDTLILKTESDTVKEILQTEGKQTHVLFCLQSYFNSRMEILKKDAGTLEFMMGQQNKTIDFEKKNRRIPLGAISLPKVEQMIETGKESVTEMTSFKAGKHSLLEQIHDFKVEKEEIQLSLIESQLQGVQNKMKYETLQYEYFRDMFESMTKMQAVLQQSTLFESVESVVKEISNGKDKLRKLKDNRDKTVEESEIQRDWFELNELQVSLVVSQDGGKLKIPGSDVSLDIPPGALQEQRQIQMKIIPLCLESLSFSSNSSVVVELLPNNLQFQKTVHLRLPHCLHLNDKYNSIKDVEVLISHHEKGDTPKWDVSTDIACTLQKDHCVIPLKQFCWITYRVDDKVVTAKRLKIFTAGRDLELSDRESEVEVGYFPDLPGSGEILRNNPKLSRGQIKPFLFQKNEEESTLLISLQQVIPTEWQNNIELGDQQIISYQSICTGTEMSCPFHLQYKPEDSPSGKVPLCLFHVTQNNAERINITFRPEVKCDED